MTIVLPSVSFYGNGHEIDIVDSASNASTNNITIQPTSGEDLKG
jgi:hypothetical protein